MQVLHDRFADDPTITVLGIHVDDKVEQRGADYIAEHGYTFPNVMQGGEMAEAFGISAVPTFVIIGADGSVIHRRGGSIDEGGGERLARIATEAANAR